MSGEISEKVREVLNNAVNGQLDNYTITIEGGKLKGENFLGEIAFVSLKNKKSNEDVALVVKQAFENLSQLQFYNTIYVREIQFYEKIWPILNKFQQDHSIGFNKIPKCYTTCSTVGYEKIVLEDLRSQQFKLYEKTKPVDRKHYEFIFKSYGMYHAISYAFREQHPEEFAEIAASLKQEKPDMEKSEQGKKFVEFAIRTFKYVRDLFDAEKDDGIYKKLDTIQQSPGALIMSEYKGDTPIVLHGDCWSNNFLFKYDSNGNVEDMRFLDFQMVGTGTPVNDLAYCFYSGAAKETMDNLNEFLEIYINSFSETLDKFNCNPEKPYTMDSLKSEWKQYGKFGFMMGVILWRIKLVDKNHVPKVTGDSMGSLYPVAEEYMEQFNTILRDLATHFYKNDYF